MKTLGLSWLRMALALVVPTALGGVVAAAIWRRFEVTIGSVIGAGAIFATILLFFAGEYIEINRFLIGCRQAVVPCRITLSEFTRYAIYGLIGFADAAAVFTLGLIVDQRRRSRI